VDELLHQLAKHDDIAVHMAQWALTLFIAGGTILYKGIWKRINQMDSEQSQDRENLNRLIGAHNATHGKKDIIERRTDPDRPTIAGYQTPIEGEDLT
jgi:hypothetical protein